MLGSSSRGDGEADLISNWWQGRDEGWGPKSLPGGKKERDKPTIHAGWESTTVERMQKNEGISAVQFEDELLHSTHSSRVKHTSENEITKVQ